MDISYNIKLPDDFYPSIYKDVNSDLNNFSDEDAMKHYFLYGQYENRLYKYDLPYDFDPYIYKNINSDINDFSNEQAIRHYFLYGKNENRIYKYSLPADFNYILYKEINNDLINFNKKELELHYIKYGINEYRHYKNNCDITVILPTLNRLDKFKNTVKKFLNQTYNNFELIIIDDGSSITIYNEKKKFINEINDTRIYLFRNAVNLKIPKTLNKGLKLSSGKYITWISDDNNYYDNFLENLYDENYNYIYSSWDFQLIFNDMPQNEKIKKFTNYNNINDLLRDENGIWDGSASFLWKTSFLKEINGWDENYHGIEDYEVIFKTYLYTKSIKKVITSGMCYYDWKNFDENNNITDQNGLTATPGLLDQNSINYLKFKKYYYNDIYLSGKILNYSNYAFPHNIPKIAFTFWYGNEFTYQHYLSIETFCFYNRDFEYIIYTISDCIINLWPTREQSTKINCINYFNKLDNLKKIYKIKIVYLDNEEEYKKYCPNIISDLVRWEKLYEHGGIWVDLDILFIKPIEYIFHNINKNCNLDEIEFIISIYKCINDKNINYIIECNTENNFFPTGLLIASKENLICKKLIEIMYSSYDENIYNSVGPNLAKSNFKNYKYFLENFNNVGIFDSELIYPHNWNNIKDYFYNYENYILNNNYVVGLHWYNGSSISRNYLNEIHKIKDNDKCFFKASKGCIELYTLQFLKIKSNASKAYIICLVIDSYEWALHIMAKTIKKVLNDIHTIFIYTTEELILNIENNNIDIKVIDIFILLNSYDVNIILDKITLVNLLPTEKTAHWICDYSSWINHENEDIMNNGRKMLLNTLENSKITLIQCDKIKTYLNDINIYPKYIFDLENIPDLDIFKYYSYDDNNIYLKKKLIVGWAGNASPYCHGWLKGLDNIKNVINKNSDKFELIYHNKFEGNDLSYNDMTLFYKNIDIYVCFSKFEGGPNTILEASASGRAWVSTNVGNVEKMVNLNNKSGIIIERTEEELEKALINLYDNRNLITELGKNARENIEINFNYINVINNTFNNIFNVLNY